MRILLPPSQGKTTPTSGRGLDLDSLPFPGLTASRAAVLEALVDLCRSDPDRALDVLGLSRTMAGEVRRNAAVLHAPCAPAWQVYTGVLFNSLDFGTLPPTAKGDGILLIASAAFGLIRPSDPIPAYRLSSTNNLPGLPSPKRIWSGPLASVLVPMSDDHLILDMRSQAYAGLFAGRSPRWVAVRVMTIRDGRRIPVSHHNKATKGLVARDLVLAGQRPHGAPDLVELLRTLGWTASQGGDGSVEVLVAQ